MEVIKGTKREDTRLIFCINSGRTGSQYLAKLLGTARHVTSFHEPEPRMNGEPLHLVNKLALKESYNLRKTKVEALRQTLGRLPAGQIYCETSHMFIKTFYDVVMDEFSNVEVIVLRRELALVLKSFLDLDYFVDLTGEAAPNRAWPHWMSRPDAATAALPLPKPAHQMDQAERCIAYLLDIEARAQRFHKDYPQALMHETRLEWLNGYTYVRRFFSQLRLEPTIKTLFAVGRKINSRIQKKPDPANGISIEYCWSRISEYLELVDKRGIEIPKGLALGPAR